MGRVGVRELRQNASELIARAEAGDEVVVTVQNREAAILVPVRRNPWVGRDAALSAFATGVDLAWSADVVEVRRGDERPDDPWHAEGAG